MYSLDIILDSYTIFKGINSYRKTASIIRNKHKCSITRQTIMNWINSINNDIKKFFNKKYYNNTHIHIIDKKSNTIDKESNNINIICDIQKLVYNDPFITRQQIINTINNKYKIKLTLNKVSKIYKKLNLTRKKPKYHVIKSLDYLDKLNIKRKEFMNNISKIDINKIISIDESGFNNSNNNSYGLSEKGKRINLPCTEKRSKNISLICAVAINKIIHYEIHDTTINKFIYYDFIKKLIDDNGLKNYYFMFDNVPFHHYKKTLELIISTSNHYIFVPPYSPNNNPIESVFSIIKNKYKNIKKVNEQQIKNKTLIKITITNIIQKDCIDTKGTFGGIDVYKKIFLRSINYNYKDIEKELRDRLIIKK